MMRNGIITVIFIVSVLKSCMWGEHKKPHINVTGDTLTYVYQLIKKRAGDCGDKPDSGCTVVKIKYPIFTEADKLNDTVTKKLTGLFGFFQTDVTLDKMTDHFLET